MILEDKRWLGALNRKERFAQRAIDKKTNLRGWTMVDMKQSIEAKDFDGTVIKTEKGELLTLGDCCLRVLLANAESDAKTNFEQKNARYLLKKRIEASVASDGKIELTESEKGIIKDRLGLFLLQVDLLGKTAELLG